MDIDYNLLHSSFSIPYLRPYQELIIRTILESYETGERKNILGILPTGSGKSLCFMYPLKLLRIRAILIYPLLSLMADQKERFDRAGIPSVVLRGGLEREERESGERGGERKREGVRRKGVGRTDRQGKKRERKE